MYVCNFWLNMNFWKLRVSMPEICLNMNFWFASFWKMHVRMHENFVLMKFLIEFENVCSNAWNLIFCYFLKDAFMNAWIFWLNLNFWFEWKCMFECVKFTFCSFWRVHLWMHKIFWMKNACLSTWNSIFLNDYFRY